MAKGNSILVPVDFSAQSLIALEQAYNLAKVTKAEITLLHTIDEHPLLSLPKLLKGGKNEESNKYFKKIQEGLDKTAAEYGKGKNIKTGTLITQGKPYEQIIKTADKLKPKFIVMGTHSGTSFIGSVTLRVVRETKYPVISIGGSVHREGCKNIVLPLDLTKETREKVDEAVEFARYFNSTIRVVSVMVDHDEFLANKLSRQMDQVKEYIEKEGVKCTAETIEKSKKGVAETIINHSIKVKADLIMIMTQQERNFTSLFIGPTAQQIIHLSDIPVLSIRPSGKYSYTYSTTSLYS